MMKASKPPSSKQAVGTVLISLIGPLTIWALHFSAVYGAHHILCAMLTDSRIGNLMLAAVSVATVAALLALLLLIVKPNVVLRMDEEMAISKNSLSFLTGVMRLLALLSLFGVLWAGSAAFFLPACKWLA